MTVQRLCHMQVQYINFSCVSIKGKSYKVMNCLWWIGGYRIHWWQYIIFLEFGRVSSTRFASLFISPDRHYDGNSLLVCTALGGWCFHFVLKLGWDIVLKYCSQYYIQNHLFMPVVVTIDLSFHFRWLREHLYTCFLANVLKWSTDVKST